MRFAIILLAATAWAQSGGTVRGGNGVWSTGGTVASACLTGYAHCAQLTAGTVTGTLTDFPVLVDVTLGSGKINNASCHDVGFTGTQTGALQTAWEIDLCTPSTGHVIAHKKITIATGTTFWIQYGGSQSTFQGSVASVWTGYGCVVHGGDGTTVSLQDSLGATPTNHGATAGAGVIGGAIYTTTSLYGDTGCTPASITNYSMSAWVYEDASVGEEIPVSSRSAGGADGIFFLAVAARPYAGFSAASGNTLTDWDWTNGAVTVAVWHYWTITHAVGATSQVLYIDGTEGSTSAATAASNPGNAGSFVIGRDGVNATTDAFAGRIDEFRFLPGTVLSVAWIAAEYANQVPGSTWLTKGTEQ